tara:strand:- start:1310 stop:1678 length:369 start_codon:yes stop_codon:yes gene_type:complete
MANRTYPNAGDVSTWYAGKSNAISSASDVSVGTHVGPATAGGVDPQTSFADYVPIHRIDNPSDGINDAADYVVYFQKLDDAGENLEVYKATNSDFSTMTKLTSGAEFDLVDPMKNATFTNEE